MRTITLIAIAACTLAMTSCGGRAAKRAASKAESIKEAITQEVTKVNLADSLHVIEGAGPVVTDNYEGLLPGADVPGINHALKLMHYETAGNGVYEHKLTYLEATDGKDETYTTRGRYLTHTGIAGNAHTAYISLVPFGEHAAEAYYAITPEGLTLLGEGLTLPVSEHNYSLVKK